MTIYQFNHMKYEHSETRKAIGKIGLELSSKDIQSKISHDEYLVLYSQYRSAMKAMNDIINRIEEKAEAGIPQKIKCE